MTTRDIKINKALFIVFLVIVFGVAFGLGTNIKNSPKKYTYTQTTNEVLSASTTVGSDVAMSNVNMTANFAASGLGSGMKKVNVSFDIKNNQSTTLEFSPGLNLKLDDSAGNSYAPTMKFTSSSVVIGGPVLPGQTRNYVVDFEVPLDANLSSLSYQKIN